MRRVLIDFARSRGYQKRGGDVERIVFDEALLVDVGRGHDLLALDEALDELARIDSRKSQIVVMRFFGGLSVEEVATVLSVSAATVTRDWKLAKSWLLRQLDRTTMEPEPMTPASWERIDEIYHAALAPSTRGASGVSRRGLPRGLALRREVESLLARATDASGFLETNAMQLVGRALAEQDTMSSTWRSSMPPVCTR